MAEQSEKRSRPFVNLLLAIVSLGVVLLIAELPLRWRYAEAVREATPEILSIQPYLELDPEIGFSWRSSVSPETNVVFEVADVKYWPLSTDAEGFINHPEAIEGKDRHVNIVGLGDSFVEHAAHPWFEQFREAGLTYYNLAIHRQCPAHYTRILERRAIPLMPDFVVYGVFENDFAEIADFDRWAASGLDWFTFHRGTWCGEALATTALARFKERWFAGYQGLNRVFRSRARGEAMSIAGPTVDESARVLEEIRRAAELCADNGVGLIVVFIPSRLTATEGATAEWRAFEEIMTALRDEGAMVLDLGARFAAHSDPASLYYAQDAHWNVRGIREAGRAILDSLPVRPAIDYSDPTR